MFFSNCQCHIFVADIPHNEHFVSKVFLPHLQPPSFETILVCATNSVSSLNTFCRLIATVSLNRSKQVMRFSI